MEYVKFLSKYLMCCSEVIILCNDKETIKIFAKTNFILAFLFLAAMLVSIS